LHRERKKNWGAKEKKVGQTCPQMGGEKRKKNLSPKGKNGGVARWGEQKKKKLLPLNCAYAANEQKKKRLVVNGDLSAFWGV